MNSYSNDLAAAERSLVGAVFVNPDCYEQVGIEPDNFYDPKLKLLWGAVGALRAKRKPLDPVMLATELGSALEACGGLSWITELAIECPVSSNAGHYAEIVRDAWLSREVVKISANVSKAAESGVKGEELLDILSRGVARSVGSHRTDVITMYDVVREQLDIAALNELPTGLPTGLGIEKWVPGGVPRDKVTMLFADEATFKTTVKNHIIMTMARAGHRVLDISLEDSQELTAHRIISQETGVPYGRIEGGVLSDAERHLLKTFDPRKLEFTQNIISGETVAPTMKDIIRAVQRYKFGGGLSAVVIDYMQILSGKGEMKDIIDDAMRQAQLASKLHSVGFIFLSQRKQESKMRKDPRPDISDMMGSSNMKNGAKLVLGLFRPFNSWQNPNGVYRAMGREEYESVLEAWVLKNVVGVVRKMMRLKVDLPTGRIQTLEGVNG